LKKVYKLMMLNLTIIQELRIVAFPRMKIVSLLVALADLTFLRLMITIKKKVMQTKMSYK